MRISIREAMYGIALFASAVGSFGAWGCVCASVVCGAWVLIKLGLGRVVTLLFHFGFGLLASMLVPAYSGSPPLGHDLWKDKGRLISLVAFLALVVCPLCWKQHRESLRKQLHTPLTKSRVRRFEYGDPRKNL
ncbi:MAG: hypothetical protein KDB27_31600 [Planctomycetales bacterium]|nr:hypothetical protein [Planctomycetales bacterium]